MNFEQFANTIPFPFVFFDQNGILTSASHTFQTRFTKAKEPYSKIFADKPQWVQKISDTFAKNIHYVLTEDDMEITPVIDENNQLFGVACYFYPVEKTTLISEKKAREDSLHQIKLIAKGLAHEIRNPLAGLKGAAQLLLQNTNPSDKQNTYCQIILRETERVNRLVTNLMDLSRDKTLAFKQLNVHQPLHNALETIKVASQKNIEFEEIFDPSLPEIKASPDALEQIFLNLIKNAEECLTKDTKIIRIKTSAANDFSVTKENKKQKMLCIEIEDNGEGVSEDDIQKIFAPYYSTKNEGSGLGLTIANQLIEKHGGSLRVKSKQGEGSTFSVFLPL